MAAVTRPGPADARIPCPLCGGLIHPIAGRCKHCKNDLRALRSARPAAAAQLPALHGVAAPGPGTNGHGHDHGHGPANGYPAAPPGAPAAPPPQNLVQAVAAAAPIPLAIHHGPADAVAILPPRPTGRFMAPAPRASWKSWPVIVIILAVIAIVAAVILMLFPPGGAPRDEGTNHSLDPAPERMNTNPTPTPRQPPSTHPDPWSRRGSGTAPTTPPTPPPDDPDIDDPDVDDALTSRDPFSRRRGGLAMQSSSMLYSIFKHACTRLSTCGTTTPQTKQLCDLYARVPSVPPPSCAAASRCLRSIDEMSCDLKLDDPTSLLQLKDRFTDCADALGC